MKKIDILAQHHLMALIYLQCGFVFWPGFLCAEPAQRETSSNDRGWPRARRISVGEFGRGASLPKPLAVFQLRGEKLLIEFHAQSSAVREHNMPLLDYGFIRSQYIVPGGVVKAMEFKS